MLIVAKTIEILLESSLLDPTKAADPVHMINRKGVDYARFSSMHRKSKWQLLYNAIFHVSALADFAKLLKAWIYPLNSSSTSFLALPVTVNIVTTSRCFFAAVSTLTI